jgi:hypothetical protein
MLGILMVHASFLAGSAATVSPVGQIPCIYDFGPERKPVAARSVLIGSRSRYDAAIGYGLVSDEPEEYISAEQHLQDELTRDGLRSPHPLRFRADVLPGSYWVRLTMDGGLRSSWKGRIVCNGRNIVNDLQPYRSDAEGEAPPSFWVVMFNARVDSAGLILEVDAADQASSMAGLHIFPDQMGPIVLEKGVLRNTTPLRAPNADMALRLINSGYCAEAQKLIEVIPDPQYSREKALLLAALAGRLEIQNPRPLLEWAVRLLSEADTTVSPDTDLNLHLLTTYLQSDSYYKMAGWEWAHSTTGTSIFLRQDQAGRLLEALTCVENHPLHHRLLWDLGRLAFHAWVEEHQPFMLQRAKHCFSALQVFYPEYRLLRIYTGEPVRTELPEEALPASAPPWVEQTRDALRALQQLIHYWVNARQSADGEFGGKYDDDVEMMRWWPLAILALDDQTALAGMQRLVDGIWTSGWIQNGFSKKLRDVEHAAEPVADTQPMMIGLDYGNPVYVERCMQSVKGIRDLWTGVNAHGHRHFKSSWYSATALDRRPPRDCDVPMNTRTVQALRWLAWYNRHPFAVQFMREWGDAWLEDCQRTDKGKPYGIVPAAIRFDDDAIGGYGADWHHPQMFWRYYDFSGGMQMLMQFLAAYDITRDAKYLEPVENAIALAIKYQDLPADSAVAGSEAWTARILLDSGHFREVIELWRQLTGNSACDDFLRRQGSEYIQFQLTRDPLHLEKGSRHVADGLLINRELISSEAVFTDRVEIGDIHQGRQWGASHLEAMFSGASFSDAFYPFYSITWQGLDTDVVAAVITSDSQQVHAVAYNLSTEVKHVGMLFWRLAPGSYLLEQADDLDQNFTPDRVIRSEKTVLRDRAARIPIQLPPGSMQYISVRQIAPGAKPRMQPCADLALTRSEVQIEGPGADNKWRIGVPVHNIGAKAAPAFSVELQARKEGRIRVLGQKTIKGLAAPLDLDPRFVAVEFTVSADALLESVLLIVVDPAEGVMEITRSNNLIELDTGRFNQEER